MIPLPPQLIGTLGYASGGGQESHYDSSSSEFPSFGSSAGTRGDSESTAIPTLSYGSCSGFHPDEASCSGDLS